MIDRNFLRVEDVARELDVSKSYAYKIVQKLNKELEDKGYITISGRVNRQYFLERTCYGGSAEDSESPAIQLSRHRLNTRASMRYLFRSGKRKTRVSERKMNSSLLTA